MKRRNFITTLSGLALGVLGIGSLQKTDDLKVKIKNLPNGRRIFYIDYQNCPDVEEFMRLHFKDVKNKCQTDVV